jgi:hypothetical protein
MPRILASNDKNKKTDDVPYQLHLSMSLDDLGKLALDFGDEFPDKKAVPLNEVPLSKKSLSSDQLNDKTKQKIVEVRVDARVCFPT